MRIPTLIFAAALFAGAAFAQDAVRAHALTPRTFTKGAEPAFFSLVFGVNPLIHGPYQLELHSTDAGDVKVILNRVEYLDFRDFQAEHRQFRTVALQSQNTLSVELKGKHSGSVTVSIIGYQYSLSSTYAGLDLFAGASGSGDIDWRTKGAVTGVQDQGRCNAAWAFSATAAVEGAVQRKSGSLLNLSEQQLVDCARAASLRGCNGGSPASATQYLMNTGAVSEASYPYTAREGVCKIASIATRVIGVLRSPLGDDTFLMQMLRSKGPVSVVVNANWLDSYARDAAANKKLIERGKKCETEPPVFLPLLLVGSGIENATPYWILKAPFGTTFGIQGYIHLARGQNTCGIADYAIVPVV